MIKELEAFNRCIGYDKESRGVHTYDTGYVEGKIRTLEDVINDIDIVTQALAPKTFYLWRNGIWSDQEKLDDELFEHFNEQEKSYERVNEQIADAYDNVIETVELDYDEYISHLKDYVNNGKGY